MAHIEVEGTAPSQHKANVSMAFNALKQSNPEAAAVLERYDIDKDGKFSTEEVAMMATQMLSVKKEARHLWRIVCALLALIFVFIGTIGGMTYAVVEATKEVEVVGAGTLGSTSGDEVVGTRTAELYVPLIVAPAMTSERLAGVASVKVIFLSPPPDLWPPVTSLVTSLVERVYHVHSVTKVSDAEIWFESTRAHMVHVKEGKAMVLALNPDGTLAWSRDVCSRVDCGSRSGCACSAMRVNSAEELAELTAKAEAALPDRRRLEETTCLFCGTPDLNFDQGYGMCALADKATSDEDMAPACVESVIAALGQTGAYTAAGVNLTCAAITTANMLGSQAPIEHICDWPNMAAACPASCALFFAAYSRRRAEAVQAEDACHDIDLSEMDVEVRSCSEAASLGYCDMLVIAKEHCPVSCGTCGKDAIEDYSNRRQMKHCC